MLGCCLGQDRSECSSGLAMRGQAVARWSCQELLGHKGALRVAAFHIPQSGQNRDPQPLPRAEGTSGPWVLLFLGASLELLQADLV